jgi:hypothetical protein
MPLLAGRISEQMTIHGELTHGELNNGEFSVENPSIEFTQVPSLDYSFLDWVSEHHSNPFTNILEFPNAIDPGHPIGTIEDQFGSLHQSDSTKSVFANLASSWGFSIMFSFDGFGKCSATCRTHFDRRM